MMVQEGLEDDALWYKDAVIYELHIKAFYDSDGDGIGDINGLTQKLDYLKDLGVTAIWLLPFYPSPLKDDGYDIADYYNIHPNYGSLREIKELLRESHKRGLRIITELVLNHTSDQHPWFKIAKASPAGSKLRNYYVWSNSPEKFKDARIIFKDFEHSNWTFDHEAKSYYWHRFYSHQPDLNFDSPNVQNAMLKVVDFWFRMGVDGLRLDAVPYLFEREGTNCENLPETHQFLKKLRKHIDKNFKNKILLAEANQWPEDTLPYFGNDDECNLAFHFPLMPRIFMSILSEDRFPILEIFEHTGKIPKNSQWAIFLRNHDELTLEMVTEEERDYMYRMYARDKQARINLGIRRRLAPLLGNDRRKYEIMNVLLFTLPGTPVVYYGDEIGMGDNFYLGDRNGVRTPMQWNADINAGFSKCNPQKLFLPVIIDPEYNYQSVNVENQTLNQSSLLWWVKRMIGIRKHFKAFGRGVMEFLTPDNNKVIAFTRKYDNESILIAMNLSRYAQITAMDLSKYAGYIPQEVFGVTDFPAISEKPYVLSFASYGYYILELKKSGEVQVLSGTELPVVNIDKVNNLFKGRGKEQLQAILPSIIKKSRWFGGKSKRIDAIDLREILPLGKVGSCILIIDVYYKDGSWDTYQLPLSYISGEKIKEVTEKHSQGLVAKITTRTEEGLLCDGVYDESFRQSLLRLIYTRKSLGGNAGTLRGRPRVDLRKVLKPDQLNIKSEVISTEQSNTSITYEGKFILKLIRRLEEGVNPEQEISEALTVAGYRNSPKLYGDIKYELKRAEPITTGILQELLHVQSDAWTMCVDEAAKYYEKVLAQKDHLEGIVLEKSLLKLANTKLPEQLAQLIGPGFLEQMSLLGKRTGEFHLALMKSNDPNLVPEQFGYLSHVSLSQSMSSYSERVLQTASKARPDNEDALQGLQDILTNKDILMNKFAELRKKRIDALRCRIHGDYHLGQILFTGKDFALIDFEGEPSRSLEERRLKRSPLRDVAGMIRSYHYAAYSALFKQTSLKPEDIAMLEKWAEFWYRSCSASFLKAYLKSIKTTGILPKDPSISATLLDAFILEKAVYELGYELNNRPNWLIIPIRGIKQILEM